MRRRLLPNAESLFAEPPATWSVALGRIALACRDQPTIVVLDEFMLIGSDVRMMEQLTTYDRPLFGRAQQLVVKPFDPAECAEVTGWGKAS